MSDLSLEEFDQQRLFDFYRIAFKRKHDPFTGIALFKPKVPKYPMAHEDDFTPRVSWAKTVKHCLGAAAGVKDAKRLYIYGVNKENMSGFVQPRMPKQIIEENKQLFQNVIKEILKRQYTDAVQNDLNTVDFVERLAAKKMNFLEKTIFFGVRVTELMLNYFIIVKNFSVDKSYREFEESEEFKKIFYAFVPDAYGTTEVWTTEPTEAKYIGELIDSKYIVKTRIK